LLLFPESLGSYELHGRDKREWYGEVVSPSAGTRTATPSPEECAKADATLVRAFDLLGKRWTGVILATLRGGPAGYRSLARAVDGISDSMLSERLAELGDAGLVSRAVGEGPPLSVTYALTDAGRALLPALEKISRWADTYLPSEPRRSRLRRR
jgi:DNA-binding HxlR family transcriptional regulator